MHMQCICSPGIQGNAHAAQAFMPRHTESATAIYIYTSLPSTRSSLAATRQPNTPEAILSFKCLEMSYNDFLVMLMPAQSASIGRCDETVTAGSGDLGAWRKGGITSRRHGVQARAHPSDEGRAEPVVQAFGPPQSRRHAAGRQQSVYHLIGMRLCRFACVSSSYVY